MNKKLLILLSLLLVCFVFPSCKENNTDIDEEEETEEEKEPGPYKVVAYLPSWKMPFTPDWEKITHLNLAFGYVNADGSLNVQDVRNMSNTIKQAQQKKVAVLMSIGGGGSQNFTSAILDEKNRARLVSNLVQVQSSLGLDGIDVDYEEWEGAQGGASALDIQRRTALEALYKELREALPEGTLITAAVTGSYDNGGWGYYNCFNNTMHEYLDYVTIMIYDETGPWVASSVGPHSSWTFFEKAISHWLNNRKLPKEKLIPGVPFYGYLFQSPTSAQNAQSVPYADILTKYPDEEAHLLSEIGLLYYDGMPMIRKKAEYVKDNKLGGMMMWEITQDTKDADKSLLNVIDDVLNQ